jgi:hypothetical protein
MKSDEVEQNKENHSSRTLCSKINKKQRSSNHAKSLIQWTADYMNHWIQCMFVGQKNNGRQMRYFPSRIRVTPRTHTPVPSTLQSLWFRNRKDSRLAENLELNLCRDRDNAYQIQSRIWICTCKAFARRWCVLSLRFASLVFFAFFCKAGAP